MKNKKMLIIIAVVVVLLGGGGAAAFFMMGGEEPEEEVVEPQEPPGVLELDSFVVNITEGGTERIAKVNINLTISPSELTALLTADTLLLARIRDRTLTLLAAKSYEELVTPLGKESLRREVKARLTPLIEEHEGTIEDVLFSEFMVQ